MWERSAVIVAVSAQRSAFSSHLIDITDKYIEVEGGRLTVSTSAEGAAVL
jgi:hypothetical protein